MENQLAELEAKLGQLLQRVEQLREENAALRQRLALESEANGRLATRISEAKQRLDGLLKRLPEGVAETP